MRLKGVFLMLMLFMGAINVNLLTFAEVIILKSGEKIEGELVEKTDQYIKIKLKDISSLTTYYLDEIAEFVGDVEEYPKKEEKEIVLDFSENKKDIMKLEELLRNEKYKEALSLIKQIIELEPDNPDYYAVLGLIYYYLDNFEEAVASFQKDIALKDDNLSIYLCLGIAYDSMGDTEKAKEVLVKYIECLKKESGLTEEVLIAETLLKKISEK